MNAVNEFIFMLKIQDFPEVLQYLENLILCHLRLTLMNVVLYNYLTVDVLRVYIKWNFKSHFLSVVFSYTQFPFYHNKLHIYPEVPILRASLQMKITILLKSKNFIMNINHNFFFSNKLINLFTFRYCHLQSINSSRKKRVPHYQVLNSAI